MTLAVEQPEVREPACLSWWRDNRMPFLLILPPIFILVITIVAPATALMWTSFTNYSPGADIRFVGLDNYTGLLTDPAFQAAAIRNIVYVVGVVFLQLCVGLGIALLLDNRLPLRSLWMALLISPFAVSSVVAVVSWKYILDPSYGAVNYTLGALGLPGVPWFSGPATSMLPIVIVAVWKGFPFIAIILFAALKAIPAELGEAARVDGASSFQLFKYVKFPYILPALSIVALFETIHAVREFDIVQIMTGGGPGTSTILLSNFLYRQGFGNYRFGLGATVGWIMLAVTLALSSLIIWRTYRRMFQQDPQR